MIDTTTSVDVGTPPTLPTPWTAPTIDYREALTPHRDLPHTGGTPMVFGASAVLLVGLVTVWVGRRRKRYVVRRGTDPQRPWIVFDRHLNVAVADFVRKDAAKHRALTFNSPREPSRRETP